MTNPETHQITLYVESTGFDVKASSFGYDPSDPDKPGSFATREDAEAFAALFPKSCKVRGSIISGQRVHERHPDGYGMPYSEGYVTFSARLLPDGVNGGRNETGIKRYRTFLAACEKLGVKVEWKMRSANALTEAELEALIS